VVERVAEAVERSVQAVGDVAAGVLEGGGCAIADGLARLGPVGRWAGGTASGLLNIAGAVLSGAIGIVGGLVAGIVRLIGGAATLDRRLAARGAIRIGSSVAGAIVLVGGTTLAALQRLVLAERRARPLSAEERAALRSVFGDSVSLHDVRIVEGRSGAFGANRRPFTLGNVVYLKDHDPVAQRDVLVHEVVHVWQYQHEGPRYTAEALGAQVRYGWAGRGAYDWRAELARGRTAWADLNKEAQGRLVQDAFAEGAASCGPVADDALAAIRSRRSRRWTARLG
jgi:hypothetical protein